MSKTFLITGVSTGMGRAFATEALAAGHRVVGTLRKQEQIAEFEGTAPGQAFGRLLDVTDDDAVITVVDDIERTIGPIDVLISNAGYGLEGTVEETTMAEFRQQFEVNVFGAVAVAKAVLPHMRRRRAGNIFFLSSIAGMVALPGVAFYGGSKFAIEGIAGSLAQEVADFGVHVTSIALGAFRTDWAGRSMVRAPRTIADYDAVFDPIRAAREAKSGRQVGDPARAARAVLDVIEGDNAPVHLVLGRDALTQARLGQKKMSDEFDLWEKLTVTTDYDGQ
jgi:NAD(P)-dependent dehydrogenase (short-subunit alcohol dehydrogenase family)